jgi:hypothetical protein
MRITKYAAMLAVGLTVFASQASASQGALAQVGSLKGSVAVEHAGSISALSASSALTAGDRIVSMEDGQAQIKFADGCIVPVQSNAVTTVGETSPCAAMGLVGGSSPMSFSDENSLLIFGGIAFIAAVALFFTAMIDDDHESISP